MTAQFNPEVRNLYEEIIKRNVVRNPRDNFEYMPQRYGGGRVREEALCGNDGHYPSIQQIENSNFGGAYGRSPHEIIVGSGRKCGGIGVLKAKVEPFINELDQDYMPVSASHGAGRAPRLTKKIKEQILDMHPELKIHMMRGGKVDFKKLWGQINSGLNVVSKVAPIISSIAPEEYRDTINKTGDISGKISNIGGRRKKAGSMSLAADLLGNYATRRRKGGNAKQFFSDFTKGFKQGLKTTSGIVAKAAPVASLLMPEFSPEIATVGALSGITNKALGGKMSQARRKSVGHAKNQARGALVRQLMRQHGMSLGEASSYIKQHNIPF